MPLDPGAWAGMEVALDKAMPVSEKPTSGSNWAWYAAGVTLVVAGGLALFSTLSVNKNDIGESIRSAPTANEFQQVEIEANDELETQTETQPEPEMSAPEKSTIAASENTRVESSRQTELLTAAAEPEENGALEKSGEKLDLPESESIDNVKPTSSQGNLLLGFTPSAMEVCAGETISFLNNTYEENVNFSWDFGDGTTSSDSDPNHVYNIPGSYHVSLSGKRKGTDVSAEQTVMIKVRQTPDTEILSEIPGPIPNLVTYNCHLFNGETAEWRFEDGMTASGNTAAHLYRNAGPKQVNLTVSNQDGCVFRTTISENITENLEFYAATAFSANGDQNNDYYFIKIVRELNIPFTFIIRNAENKEVFTTTDPMDGWNGKLNNNGPELPEGKYSWRLILDSKYLRDNQKTGTVVLTRN